MTNKPLKRGDIVRVVDGSPAHGDIGVVRDVFADGYIRIDLAVASWTVRPNMVKPLGPLPVLRRWVVELEPDVWLAAWSGDPGRSCVLSHARVFAAERHAKRALGIARSFAPFQSAVVRQLP